MNVTQRGKLSPEDERQLLEAWAVQRKATVDYKALLAEMVERTSYREVARFTGLSTQTLQRWKQEAGK